MWSIVDVPHDFIAERGMAAMGPLMGIVLKELGEGADGGAVSVILQQRLKHAC